MRKYPEKYLEVLKNEVNIIENNGVKIIFKPSPGEKRDGYLDPCEKEIMDVHFASKSNDKEENQKDVKENVDTNFGMVHPEGYRKALRFMKQAE